MIRPKDPLIFFLEIILGLIVLVSIASMFFNKADGYAKYYCDICNIEISFPYENTFVIKLHHRSNKYECHLCSLCINDIDSFFIRKSTDTLILHRDKEIQADIERRKRLEALSKDL